MPFVFLEDRKSGVKKRKFKTKKSAKAARLKTLRSGKAGVSRVKFKFK